METMTLPRQLLGTVDDNINIGNVTRAIKMVKGVTDIKPAKPKAKKPRLYDSETGKCLNDKTMKVIENVRKGKEEMISYNSFEEFEEAMRKL